MNSPMFDSVAPFTPQQIVYLEAHLEQESCGAYARLYGEVIQWIPQRGMCWVRPLFWVKYSDPETDPQVEDLRQASDLVWPDHGFQVALDTETIPLLVQLNPRDGFVPDSAQQAIARQRLNRVMKFFWRHSDTRH